MADRLDNLDIVLLNNQQSLKKMVMFKNVYCANLLS